MRTSTTSRPFSANRPTERVLDLTRSGPGKLAYAAVYPNGHAVGMANLGFQTLVALLSGFEGGACHRAFSDFPRSIEAGRALREYDVIALSLSFEGDYPTALRLLNEGKVPLRSADRSGKDPLVLAGGIAPSLNPEPLAPFLDVVFLGEAEIGLALFHQFLIEHRGRDRARLLELLAEARIPGVYVPSRYEVADESGSGGDRSPKGSAPETVRRAWAEGGWEPARTRIWTPEGPFRGAYLLEVSRGCLHGCRFCAAGFATRPARFLPLRDLEPWLRFGAREVGRVGLVGAAVSDHPDLIDLGEAVLDEGGEFTVSSFRVENLDPDRMNLLVRGGLKTLTVALEAGTDHLRRLVGKNIADDHLVEAARMAGDAGLESLRVYAMVGLPGETEDDIRALASLVARARRALRKGVLTVSVTPFVPKPQTPLQWEPMAPEAVLRKRIRLLERLCGPQRGVHVVAEAPKWARVQGLLSRGGRAVAPLLEAASRTDDWRNVLRSAEAVRVLDRKRDPRASLPWEFIQMMPSREHLQREREAARRGDPPSACRPTACQVCGICEGSLKSGFRRADS